MFLFVLTVMDIKQEQHDPCLTYAIVNQDEFAEISGVTPLFKDD